MTVFLCLFLTNRAVRSITPVTNLLTKLMFVQKTKKMIILKVSELVLAWHWFECSEGCSLTRPWTAGWPTQIAVPRKAQGQGARHSAPAGRLVARLHVDAGCGTVVLPRQWDHYFSGKDTREGDTNGRGGPLASRQPPGRAWPIPGTRGKTGGREEKKRTRCSISATDDASPGHAKGHAMAAG